MHMRGFRSKYSYGGHLIVACTITTNSVCLIQAPLHASVRSIGKHRTKLPHPRTRAVDAVPLLLPPLHPLLFLFRSLQPSHQGRNAAFLGHVILVLKRVFVWACVRYR